MSCVHFRMVGTHKFENMVCKWCGIEYVEYHEMVSRMMAKRVTDSIRRTARLAVLTTQALGITIEKNLKKSLEMFIK